MKKIFLISLLVFANLSFAQVREDSEGGSGPGNSDTNDISKVELFEKENKVKCSHLGGMESYSKSVSFYKCELGRYEGTFLLRHVRKENSEKLNVRHCKRHVSENSAGSGDDFLIAQGIIYLAKGAWPYACSR